MFNFKISISIDPSSIINAAGATANFITGNTIGAVGHVIDTAGATAEFVTGNTIGAVGHVINVLPIKVNLTVNEETAQSYYFRNKV